MRNEVVGFAEAYEVIMNGGKATCLGNGKTYSKCTEHGHEGSIIMSDKKSNCYRGDFSFNSLEIESRWLLFNKEEIHMNDKHEFQVGDLVRLKSVEEILALGFGFNERGEIAYPKSKTVLLLTSELKHCGDEFVVDDFTEIGRIDLKSPNSVERIVNICPSVLELVEVEEVEEEDWITKPTLQVKPGDKVRIKTHDELLGSGWIIEDNIYHYVGKDKLSDIEIVNDMTPYLGKTCTIETIIDEYDDYTEFHLEEDGEWFYWTSYMVAEVVTDVEVATFEDKYCQDSEVDTYRDEEGNPFDPNTDYIEEEDYQPYCAVVDDAPVRNNTYSPTTWDKERIQRGFENLEIYHKGYADGFQRAMELMKKEFGVE